MFPDDAVSVTVFCVATENVTILTVAVLAPLGTLTVVGTEATVPSELVNVMTWPVEAATPSRDTVAMT